MNVLQIALRLQKFLDLRDSNFSAPGDYFAIGLQHPSITFHQCQQIGAITKDPAKLADALQYLLLPICIAALCVSLCVCLCVCLCVRLCVCLCASMCYLYSGRSRYGITQNHTRYASPCVSLCVSVWMCCI